MARQKPKSEPSRPKILGSIHSSGKIFDALATHIALLDGSGVIIAVNEAWNRFAQLNDCPDKQYYVGSNYLKVCENAVRLGGDKSAKAALNGIQAILAGEQETFTLEYSCSSPNEERWFILRASCFKQAGAIFVVTAHEDITMQKRIEEQADHQAQLLANVNDVVIGTDENFRITYWNPAAEKLFGWIPNEVMGLSAAEVLRTEFCETDRAESARILIEQGQWSGEVIQYTKDNHPLFFEAKILTVFDPDGKVAGYVSANRDITKRKHAMNALQASETRYQKLTQSLPDAIYSIDLVTKRVTYFNHNAFLGYTREEIMGTNSLLGALHSEDQAMVMAYWQRAIRGMAENSIEYRLRNKSGQWEWVESRTTTIGNGTGDSPSELIVILTIITERKKAEKDLYDAKAEVEAVNQQLQQSLAHEEFMARTDALTQVNNRRHFFDLAEHEFATAKRYGRQLSFILFDIDYFKQINDTYGHPIGDKTLQIVAQIADENLREADILGRYGGEEFAIMLPDTSAQESLIVAERIRKGVANHLFETQSGSFQISISLGLTEFLPQDDTLDHFIQRVDNALYNAKRTGRNRTILV
jgi:diguanylate cyclase (GGDEF)-like protein/PAS domain S-box-containing protein